VNRLRLANGHSHLLSNNDREEGEQTVKRGKRAEEVAGSVGGSNQ